MKRNRSKGQALVIIALALVGLLAIVAMAVDGSMVYSDRRELQGAADNAVMSAASVAAMTMDNAAINYQTFICESTDPDHLDEVLAIQAAEIAAINAAINRTNTYGYPIDTDLSDHNGVNLGCHIIVNAGLVERYFEIRVEITHQSRTGFTRFILPEGVSNTVEAVSRVYPRQSLSMGNAIASLSDSCGNDGGIDAGGSNTININGGGVFSNSCMFLHGNEDITINVDYGGIGYVESYTQTGNVTINPTGLGPEQSTEKLPYLPITTPDCFTGMTDYGSITVDGTRTINPGRYNGIALGGSDHLIMNPGLYCFFGSFSTQGGQTIEVNPASPAEQGVTIYMASGDVTFNGNSLIILRAPSIYMDPALKGMLIYLPETNHGTVSISGTSGSSYQGTIYAPYGKIAVSGTADIPLATELVAGKVSISGNAVIDITDDAFVNFTRSPLIELTK